MLRDTAKYTTGKIASPITSAPARNSGQVPASCCETARLQRMVRTAPRRRQQEGDEEQQVPQPRQQADRPRNGGMPMAAHRRHGQASFSVPPTSASDAGLRQHPPRRRDRPAAFPTVGTACGTTKATGSAHAQGGHGGGRRRIRSSIARLLCGYPTRIACKGYRITTSDDAPQAGRRRLLPGRSRAWGKREALRGHNPIG